MAFGKKFAHGLKKFFKKGSASNSSSSTEDEMQIQLIDSSEYSNQIVEKNAPDASIEENVVPQEKKRSSGFKKSMHTIAKKCAHFKKTLNPDYCCEDCELEKKNAAATWGKHGLYGTRSLK